MESVASLTHRIYAHWRDGSSQYFATPRANPFLPMPVERYVKAAALYRRVPWHKAPELVAPATKINLSTWSATPGQAAAPTSSSTSSTNSESEGVPHAGGVARIAHGFRVEAPSRWSAYSVVSSLDHAIFRSCEARFPAGSRQRHISATKR